jgi:uncharacterized protein DUF4410
MRSVMALAVMMVVCAALARPVGIVAQGSPVQTVKDGLVDEVKLYVAKLPETKTVVMRPFSATDADIKEGDKKEETKKMQPIAGRTLGDEFVTQMKKLGPFTDVSLLADDATPPADAIVVEGKFTEMDPGSAAKRAFVGYGAGKSGVKVEGSIKKSDGTLLATFNQRRVGVMSGGYKDSMGKLMGDTIAIGEDIAKLLNAWGTGKKLK